jgi:hypothetical protein
MPYNLFTGPDNESGTVSLVFADSWLSVVGCWLLIVCVVSRSVFLLSVPTSSGSNPGQQIATVSF